MSDMLDIYCAILILLIVFIRILELIQSSSQNLSFKQPIWKISMIFDCSRISQCVNINVRFQNKLHANKTPQNIQHH